MSDLTLDSLADRLARVERQNRRLKAAAIVGAAALAAALCLGQMRVPEPLAAQRFVLRDAGGKMQATLSASPEGPGLSLYAPDGGENPRLGLYVSEMGPTIVLNDEQGQHRVTLSALTGPTVAGGVGLKLAGDDGKARAHLFLSEEGPALTLLDAQDKPRASLRLGWNGEPALEFVDAHARTLPVAEEKRGLTPRQLTMIARLETEFMPELRRINKTLADFDNRLVEVEDWIAGSKPAQAAPEPENKP